MVVGSGARAMEGHGGVLARLSSRVPQLRRVKGAREEAPDKSTARISQQDAARWAEHEGMRRLSGRRWGGCEMGRWGRGRYLGTVMMETASYTGTMVMDR